MDYRRPLAGERDRLVAFLTAHWRKDHLFVADPDWLDWQHLDAAGDAYHAICAFDADGRIVGFLGVMPLDADGSALSTGIWVVDRSCPDRTVGLSLFRWLERLYPARYIGSLGVNPQASAVLRMLGHRTGIAETFVVAGAAAATPAISAGLPPRPRDPDSLPAVVEVGGVDALFARARPAGHLPVKPAAWHRWRYEAGAPFAYRFLSIEGTGVGMVARVVEAEGGAMLRIVDVVGDIAGGGLYGAALGPLLDREGLEYAELLVGGADLSAFEQAGFGPRPADCVLPAYFDPFSRTNASLGWTIRLHKDDAGRPAYLFRGECDQDRPNRPGPQAPRAMGRPL